MTFRGHLTEASKQRLAAYFQEQLHEYAFAIRWMSDQRLRIRARRGQLNWLIVKEEVIRITNDILERYRALVEIARNASVTSRLRTAGALRN